MKDFNDDDYRIEVKHLFDKLMLQIQYIRWRANHTHKTHSLHKKDRKWWTDLDLMYVFEIITQTKN